MRTILMSFKQNWFEKIISGEKIFEYRSSFADEEVIAYMYVSSPRKEICGRIHLGKRILLKKLKENYKNNTGVADRVDYYMKKHRFVMPILSVQKTYSISLAELRENLNTFVVPQMYYYLDERQELLKYIELNAKTKGEPINNNFDNLPTDEICRIYI